MYSSVYHHLAVKSYPGRNGARSTHRWKKPAATLDNSNPTRKQKADIVERKLSELVSLYTVRVDVGLEASTALATNAGLAVAFLRTSERTNLHGKKKSYETATTLQGRRCHCVLVSANRRRTQRNSQERPLAQHSQGKIGNTHAVLSTKIVSTSLCKRQAQMPARQSWWSSKKTGFVQRNFKYTAHHYIRFGANLNKLQETGCTTTMNAVIFYLGGGLVMPGVSSSCVGRHRASLRQPVHLPKETRKTSQRPSVTAPHYATEECSMQGCRPREAA